jgi:hypothetical protein
VDSFSPVLHYFEVTDMSSSNNDEWVIFAKNNRIIIRHKGAGTVRQLPYFSKDNFNRKF